MQTEITLTEPVSKACYDSLHETLYLLLPQSNSIAVYKGGKRVNTIGGLGYADTQFSKLSDIAIGPDSKLLALDSFRAHIKRFDHNGDLVSTFALKGLTDPRLLAASTGGNLYVWDAVRRDITLITDPPAEEPYRFGRFILEQPDMLSCAGDWLWAWDGGDTELFTRMGQHQSTLTGWAQLNAYGSRFLLQGSYVQQQPDGQPLALSPQPWRKFWLSKGVMIIAGDNRLWMGRLDYATP